jgi:serine kinase of HPr protein (carbohydrate metabolism regulator)
MTKLEDIVKKLDLQILSKGTGLDRSVSSGYCCDLLSWVMANGKKDAVWITVQTHTNVIAVATLLELAGIIIPSGIPVDPKTIEKAEEEGIAVLSSGLGAFELSGILYQMGIGS